LPKPAIALRGSNVVGDDFEVATSAAKRHDLPEFAGNDTHGIQNVADAAREKLLGFLQRRHGNAASAGCELRLNDGQAFGRFHVRTKPDTQRVHPLLHPIHVVLHALRIDECSRRIEVGNGRHLVISGRLNVAPILDNDAAGAYEYRLVTIPHLTLICLSVDEAKYRHSTPAAATAARPKDAVRTPAISASGPATTAPREMKIGLSMSRLEMRPRIAGGANICSAAALLA
jgi:hypothetical protein